MVGLIPLPRDRPIQPSNWRAKLTPDEAIEIYHLAKDGVMSQREIARRYGISQRNVLWIKQKQIWKAVLEEG
jgi:DNA invertase Pin-like site-specific DNA recombinase